MGRMIVWLTLCAAVVGCTRINEAAMPVAAKISAAHPVSVEVRLTRERLQSLLAADGKALEAADVQFESRMTLRALTCSRNAAIGRLASVASVKAMTLEPRCFQDQDKELLKFLGVRTIGVLLLQPALRPLKALGPAALLPSGDLSPIQSGSVAAAANVAVVRSGRGEYTAVEIPGGARIASLPAMPSAYAGGLLSPNGRVFALPNGTQGVAFIEMESGNRLWEPVDASRPVAWLPEAGALLYTSRDSVLTLVDTLSGSVEPHPLGLRQVSWGTRISQSPSRTLLGDSHEAYLVEHIRTPEGIRASVIKQYRIGAGQGVTSSAPMAMRDGKLVVFNSGRDIGWLNLESGDSGLWKTSPYFGIPFSRLDQTHLLFDSVERNALTRKSWVFDIVAETVAPADLGLAGQGLGIDIGDRTGFMRRSNSVWSGDSVSTGEPVALAKVTADYDLQLQMAKLQAQTQPMGMPAVDGIPGAPAMAVPALGDVPPNAQIHIVGVYQGSGDTGMSVDGHRTREVRVNARGPGRPIVLVLASYDPVRWTVVNQGARVSAVLLAGYHASTVIGAGSVPTIRIGNAYAYSPNSAEYPKLRQAIVQYTNGREIRSFQGSYTGTEFSIGP